jgi:pyruvate dehydrogenase E2 component (dihydrolipoamide acetyltransferase)
MPTEVTMPRLSDTMEEGKILKWLKSVGDAVAVGDVLAEVETDKANMELEAFDAGVLSEIRVAEGDAAPVGAVIAVLGGEAKVAPAKRAEPAADPAAPAQAAAAKPAPQKAAGAATSARPAKPAPSVKPPGTADGKPAGAAKAPTASDDRVRASPRARRIASERGIDLSRVQGTGPGGRILEQDLTTATSGAAAATERPEQAPAEEQPPVERAPAAKGAAPRGGGRRVELGKIRRTTASRMAAAKRDVPHFYATSDLDAGALMQVKDDLRGRGGEWSGVTVTHLLLKAVGVALREVPELNASWDDGAVVMHDEVNVGLAVSIDDGLIVPVVRRCDAQPLAALVKQASEVVARARSGKFGGDDLVGSTFAVSNLGMYPVAQFAAVVNPPNAGILAVGAVRDVPVVRPGQIVPGHVMTVTLSCDHRVVDGVIAGRFLQALKARVEDPRSLLD